MRISHEPGDGSFDVVLDLHDPLPLEWARCPAARITRRIEHDKIKIIKEFGEVLEC